MDVLKLLEKFDFVASYEILQFKEMDFGYYYKIKIVLSDHTESFATEYVDINERNYSFHWQERSGLLKSRRDNAYHHKQIITFPHHRHIGKKYLRVMKFLSRRY